MYTLEIHEDRLLIIRPTGEVLYTINPVLEDFALQCLMNLNRGRLRG